MGVVRRGAGVAVACALTLAAVACAPEPDPAAPATSTAGDAPFVTGQHMRVAVPGEPLAVQKRRHDPAEARAQAAIDDPSSYQVVVNKLRPLSPRDWAPSDLVQPSVRSVHGQPLRREVAAALDEMLAAARAAGAGSGFVQSGYRDYDTQVTIYHRIVGQLGQHGADQTSARPGHSEHQTGLAVDIDDGTGCVLAACFGDTPLGKWLAEHAWEYGFLLRYPADKTAITGYEYEPWHFRYVQRSVSADMHRLGIRTLEEYYGLAAAPDYAE